MSKKTYSASFNFQVALEAIRSKRTNGEIARTYRVHPVTVSNWKSQLLDEGAKVFGGGGELKRQQKKIADLERLLGQKEIEMALRQRHLAGKLLHHSDRGSQYASVAYQRPLSVYGIACSMSRRGTAMIMPLWRASPQALAHGSARHFGTLKTELIHHRDYQTRVEAKALFEYLEVWYNRKRRHSSLGYLSPAEYEARMATPRTA